jgi:hypothetical protein
MLVVLTLIYPQKKYRFKKKIIHDGSMHVFINSEKCNLTGQTLNLFSRDYQFESHKPQNHYKFI